MFAGPIAVVASALAGAAASKGSRWWLAAVVAPWLAGFFIATFLGTAHVLHARRVRWPGRIYRRGPLRGCATPFAKAGETAYPDDDD